MILIVFIFVTAFKESAALFTLIDSSGRLVSGKTPRLLLYNDGTVCDDNFTMNTANAICKDMGLTGAMTWRSNSENGSNPMFEWIIQHSHPIAMGNVVCPKGAVWENCSFTEHIKNCIHREDVFLSCIDECPTKSYKHKISSVCIKCTNSITSNSDSCTCPVGWEWIEMEQAGSCQPCPVNEYKTHNMTRCLHCPPNSNSNLGSSYCACSAGTFWNGRVCDACPEKSTSDPGSSYCNCEAGFFWGDGQCMECEEGSFSEIGAKFCTQCISLSNKTSCTCPEGDVWNWDNGKCQRDSYVLVIVTSCILGVIGVVCVVVAVILVIRKRKVENELGVGIVMFREDDENLAYSGWPTSRGEKLETNSESDNNVYEIMK